jgi:hypothetical protein
MPGEDIAETVVKVKQGGLGGFFSGLLGFLKYWKTILTIVFLLWFMWGSVKSSIQEKSFYPAIMGIGGLLFGADNEQYITVKEIENNNWRIPSDMISQNETDGLWRDIKSLFAKISFFIELFGHIWFIFIIGYLFYLAIKALTNSSIFIHILFTVFLMAFLNASFSIATLYLNYNCGIDSNYKCLNLDDRINELGFSSIPFKGVGYTFYHFFWTQNLWKETIMKSAVPFTVYNQTNSTVIKEL